MDDPVANPPVADDSGEKKKKKRRYSSKRVKNLHAIEKGLSRAAKRVAKAAVEGTKTWEKARDKSARKKKDGQFKDAVTNGLRASAKTAVVASRASLDLFDAARPLLPSRKKLVKAFFPKPK